MRLSLELHAFDHIYILQIPASSSKLHTIKGNGAGEAGRPSQRNPTEWIINCVLSVYSRKTGATTAVALMHELVV